MGKTILGVVVGYLAMAIFVFVTFSIVYLAMGTENAFEENSFEVSTLWLLASIVLGFIAAILGGMTAVAIGKNQRTALYLAGLTLVLGIAMAVPTLSAPIPEGARTGEVSTMDAMQTAHQPPWIAFLNPVIGVVGIMIGSRLKKQPSSK